MDTAAAEGSGFTMGFGPVMGHLGSGPLMSPGVASGLGFALNKAGGLPTTSLTGPGSASNAACCPLGHGFVGQGQMQG